MTLPQHHTQPAHCGDGETTPDASAFTAAAAAAGVWPQVGAALGLAAAGYLLKDNKGAQPLHFLGGAGVGAATGVLLHMLTRPVDHRTPNKMMHELRN